MAIRLDHGVYFRRRDCLLIWHTNILNFCQRCRRIDLVPLRFPIATCPTCQRQHELLAASYKYIDNLQRVANYGQQWATTLPTGCNCLQRLAMVCNGFATACKYPTCTHVQWSCNLLASAQHAPTCYGLATACKRPTCTNVQWGYFLPLQCLVCMSHQSN